MTHFVINWFDIGFISALLLVGFLAFLKGFIREFLSMASWLIALLTSYIITPLIAKIFAKSHFSELAVDLIISTILFVVILIIASIMSSRINKKLTNTIPASVDQSLGFALGLVKAYLIIALFFSIITTIYSYNLFFSRVENKNQQENKQENARVGPGWLTKSYSYPLLAIGAKIVQPITDIAIDSIKDIGFGNQEEGVNQSSKSVKEIQELNKTREDYQKQLDGEGAVNSDGGSSNDSDSGKGYSKQERDKMSRLIDIIDKQ